MLNVVYLLGSLVVILIGAELFTNAIEWLGKKLNLNQGAVGSVLAAVGTALPETVVPIIALLSGTGESNHEIGVGAILGAPFMLSTLAMFVAGLAVWIYARRGRRGRDVQICGATFSRDMKFFLGVYALAILAALLPSQGLKQAVAVGLVLAYALYVYWTFTHPEEAPEEEEELLHPLTFDRGRPAPRTALVVAQIVAALGGIVLGAKFFVQGLEHIAHVVGLSPFVLSVIITPIATELPEKFNSVIWLRRCKDTLAVGNVTGAMVFQSSVIPAVGIWLTPWELGAQEMVTALLSLASAASMYLYFLRHGRLNASVMMAGGAFYAAFLGYVIFK